MKTTVYLLGGGGRLYRKALAYVRLVTAAPPQRGAAGGDTRAYALSASGVTDLGRRRGLPLTLAPKLVREGWGMIAAGQLRARLVGLRADYVILAGRAYYDALRPHLPQAEGRVTCPFEGMRGLGDMERWLNVEIARLEAEAHDRVRVEVES